MKLFVLSALLVAVVPCAAAAARERGAEVVGWALDDYDMPYLRSAIDRAPEFDVNMIVLCYLIPKHGSQLPEDPETQRDLNELVERAHAEREGGRTSR